MTDIVPGFPAFGTEEGEVNPDGAGLAEFFNAVFSRIGQLRPQVLSENDSAAIEDIGKTFLLSNHTLTLGLASALKANWFCLAKGPGIVTSDPAEPINDLSSISLTANGWAILVCDGEEFSALISTNEPDRPDAIIPTFADRADYDDEVALFSVLIEADETRGGVPTRYYKLSADNADWSVGFSYFGGTRVERTVTEAGAVAIAADDGIVFIDKTVGEATTVNLPPVATKNGPVTIVDGKGDAKTNNITVTADGEEKILGQATRKLRSNFEARTFSPNPEKTKWYIT